MSALSKYRKLDIYPLLLEIVDAIYLLTSVFPKSEAYGLGGQLRRAGISTISNLVEGLSRTTEKEKKRFIEMSYGSLLECNVQLEISLRLKYISKDQYESCDLLIQKSAQILSGLRRRFNS